FIFMKFNKKIKALPFLFAQILSLVILSLEVCSQEIKLTVFIESLNGAKKTIQKQYNNAGEPDKYINRELNTMLAKLWGEGFIEARTDSLVKKDLNYNAYINKGSAYELENIEFGKDIYDIAQARFGSSKQFKNKIFNYEKISAFAENLLTYCENTGYPFAKVKLDSFIIINNKVKILLNIDKGDFFRIDTLLYQPANKIPYNYINTIIGIKQGTAYCENDLRKIALRINNIDFIECKASPDLKFYEEKTKLLIRVERRQSNSMEAMLGLLSDNSAGNKIVLSGDLKIKLTNAFGKAELINFEWSSPGRQSQNLNTQLRYPCLLNTPFGADYKFDLLKKDSSFIKVIHNIGIIYSLKGNKEIKAFYQNLISNNFINNKSPALLNQLSDYANSRAGIYGLEFYLQNIDYIFNPTKGFALNLSFGAGNKTISKNSGLTEDIYKELNKNKSLLKTKLHSDIYFNIYSKNVVMLSFKQELIQSQTLFKNDLFLFGGLKTLRGFDEDFLNASSYNILSAEYRFLPDRNTYISIFTDVCYYEKKINKTYFSDTPFGFGAGITFLTRAGVFSFNYALGKQKNMSPKLNNAKIHFGYISRFK
ncbi:MAG: hypothetical protein KA792_04195, partial [Bacteroidales bacterium]|nr:hypothetical protein [Bacteroidales bacterium]